MTETQSVEAGGDAERRVLRILYVSIGIGGIVYLAVGFSKAMAQFGAMGGVAGLVLYCVAAAGPFLLLALAPWASLTALRRVALAHALTFWGVMLAFPLVMTQKSLPGSDSPWTNDLMTVPAVAMAVGARRPVIAAYVLATSITSGVIRYLTAPEVGVTLAALDLAYNFLFDCAFVALTLVTRSSAVRLDAAAEAARVKTSHEAEASARVQQRIRIDALVHDHVLSALLIASRADAVPTPALRELAASTLRTLNEEALPPHQVLSGEEFVGRLRSTVSSQGAGIAFDGELGAAVRVPADIAQALIEATSEAVRNSLLHAAADDAGGDVTRLVRVASLDGGLAIVVRDDGRGFNSRRIPPERLGVRVSILNRMATLPGGHADIESGRGLGTRVTLAWSPEEVA
ncbi:two-component sensor histidine kinase [Frondihabitans sp. PhB188]|uniref:sensor histidine kinase n=1 Tax=Frondihabitans sp. PhB188 TaxID=2485200 RepID=UPI000F464C88|nr:ATP-binding protein [Frondihabitans sp. PhB188]ROQ39964.1 two-component sensor histidine kinase [Frondihabitans sp. PhB188]